MKTDTDVVNEAITEMAVGFDLLFVHLPQVDQVGHFSGWMSPEYMPASAETQTRLRSTSSVKKSVSTGSAATSVESGQKPSGS